MLAATPGAAYVRLLPATKFPAWQAGSCSSGSESAAACPKMHLTGTLTEVALPLVQLQPKLLNLVYPGTV